MKGISRRRAAYLPTEGQLQDQIVEGLRRLGFTVLEIGRWRSQVQCPCGCGHYFTPHTGYGNSPGTPDLFVYAPCHGAWIGLELKVPAARDLFGPLPAGRLRPEQQALAEAGYTRVVHSLEEALVALRIPTPAQR